MVIAQGLLLICSLLIRTDDTPKPIAENWDYTPAMKKVLRESKARPGVVLHVGDSITYANPYGQWARGGDGQTADDKAVLKWMHAGADNDTDGWYLARFDHPDGGRSHTAAGGMRADELLAGGKQHLPPLEKIVEIYRPQMVVLMIGTNDITAGRKLADYRADIERAVDIILKHGAIPILSTIPPHPQKPADAKAANESVRELAKQKSLPLIDYEQEILRRRPDDWNGTLLGRDDVHPTSQHGSANAGSSPTPEHLRDSGYLLRGWLSVQKIAEVKRRVIDER